MRKKGERHIWPLLVLVVVSWLALGAMVVMIDPEVVGVMVFLPVFFLAWFFILTLVLKNTRRGLIYGLGILLVAILQLMRLANIVNLVLLGSVVMVVDFYFMNR